MHGPHAPPSGFVRALFQSPVLTALLRFPLTLPGPPLGVRPQHGQPSFALQEPPCFPGVFGHSFHWLVFVISLLVFVSSVKLCSEVLEQVHPRHVLCGFAVNLVQPQATTDGLRVCIDSPFMHVHRRETTNHRVFSV